MNIEGYQQKIKGIVVQGAYFCSTYFNEKDLKSLAARIYIKGANLPAFTLTVKDDKFTINRARFNLYSLLIPVHDREKVMDDFWYLALEWQTLAGKGGGQSINGFCSAGIFRQNVEGCIKEFLR